MHLTLGELIVWLIVGGLAGNLAGRLVTFKKEGFGRWINLALGMGGALIGGVLFNVVQSLFGIKFKWGELKITFEDLISAFLGALLLIVVWWSVRWYRGRNRTP